VSKTVTAPEPEVGAEAMTAFEPEVAAEAAMAPEPEVTAKAMTAFEPEVAATAGICCEVVPASMMAFEHCVALMPMAGCAHSKTSLAVTDPDFELPPETVMDTESRVISKTTVDANPRVIVEVRNGYGGGRTRAHDVTQHQDDKGSEDCPPGFFRSHASHLISLSTALTLGL